MTLSMYKVSHGHCVESVLQGKKYRKSPWTHQLGGKLVYVYHAINIEVHTAQLYVVCIMYQGCTDAINNT